jgi:hypothetical protein
MPGAHLVYQRGPVGPNFDLRNMAGAVLPCVMMLALFHKSG